MILFDCVLSHIYNSDSAVTVWVVKIVPWQVWGFQLEEMGVWCAFGVWDNWYIHGPEFACTVCYVTCRSYGMIRQSTGGQWVGKFMGSSLSSSPNSVSFIAFPAFGGLTLARANATHFSYIYHL